MKAPERCDQALEEAERYMADGTAPEKEEDLLEFLMEKLAIGPLLGLLTESETEFLRASMVCGGPVPVSAFAKISANLGEKDSRLTDLGLWDAYPDMVNRTETAVAVNPLVRPRLKKLSEKEMEMLAGLVAGPLFAAWGGEGGKKRPPQAQWQLAVLGAAAKHTEMVKAGVEDAVEWLIQSFRYREAAQLAEDGVSILENANIPVPAGLYLRASDVLVDVGKIDLAESFVKKAIRVIRDKTPDADIRSVGMGAALLRHGRILKIQGHITSAVKAFEEAKITLQAGGHQRETAVTLVEIARIKVLKGDVDEALKLHYETLDIFEALGDRRSRAVTLGDIARIKVLKGDVDEALKLQNERRDIFEALGDRRERAVTLCDTGQIMVMKGDTESALRHLGEAYQIAAQLGDAGGLSIVGIVYGQMLIIAGRPQEAKPVLALARNTFLRLGKPDEARKVETLLAQLG